MKKATKAEALRLQFVREAEVARALVTPLLAARDAEGLTRIKDVAEVYRTVCDAVVSIDLTDKLAARFVHALSSTFMSRPYSHAFWPFVEAALRMKDTPLVTDAMLRVESESDVAGGERHAIALGQRGELDMAVRMLEVLTRLPVTTTTSWNNAVHFLAAQSRPTLPAKQVDALLRGARATAAGNPAVLHNLACAYVKRNRLDDALACVRDAVSYGYHGIEALETDKDLAVLRKDKRFAAAFAQKPRATPAHLVVERKVSDEKGQIRLVAPAVGLHLYFANRKAAPAIGELVERLASELPGMFAFCAPQDGMPPREVKKGRVSRDVSALRGNKSPRGFELHYDNGAAAASDQRLLLDLDDIDGGELTLHLPLALTENADALVERLIGIARGLPFVSGSAGFTLSSYYRGTRVASKAAGVARGELHRLMPGYLGLTMSQLELGFRVQPEIATPAWLTFLGPAMTKKLGPGFAKAIAPATVIDLGGGRWAVRASRAPSLGAKGDAPSLEALPKIARVLAQRLPAPTFEDHHFAAFATPRRDALAKLA